jgi:hypothetical protein
MNCMHNCCCKSRCNANGCQRFVRPGTIHERRYQRGCNLKLHRWCGVLLVWSCRWCLELGVAVASQTTNISSVEHSKRRFKILGNNLNYCGSLAVTLPHGNAYFLLDIHPSTPGDSLQHAVNVWNVTPEVKTAYAQPSCHNLRITGPPQAPYYANNTRLKREAKHVKIHASATNRTHASLIQPKFRRSLQGSSTSIVDELTECLSMLDCASVRAHNF